MNLEKPPFTRNFAKRPQANLFKLQARSGNQIFYCPRHQHAAITGSVRDVIGEIDGKTAIDAIDDVAFAGVQTGFYMYSQTYGGVGDRRGAPDSPGRTIENG